MGIASRGISRDQGIEQISGWLAGMASTVVTAPTNGQVQVQDTRGNHTICHSDFEHNEYRALERVSRGPAAGQAIMRAQRARGSQVANTKGEAIEVNGNSFRRGQSIGGHSVTQGKRCFEAMTTPLTTGPSGFLYHKPVPNSFSRGALAPWHQGTRCGHWSRPEAAQR